MTPTLLDVIPCTCRGVVRHAVTTVLREQLKADRRAAQAAGDDARVNYLSGRLDRCPTSDPEPSIWEREEELRNKVTELESEVAELRARLAGGAL